MTTSTTTVQIPVTGTYRLDPGNSTIAFTAKHMFGTGTVAGSFAVTSGQIVVTEPVTKSQVTASASSRSFDSANDKRDTQVKSAKFLDAEAHPEITFSSTRLENRDGQWVLVGAVTARGTSAPVELTITESRSDATGLTLRATGQVDRYAHGITKMKGMAGRFLSLDITARANRI